MLALPGLWCKSGAPTEYRPLISWTQPRIGAHVGLCLVGGSASQVKRYSGGGFTENSSAANSNILVADL